MAHSCWRTPWQATRERGVCSGSSVIGHAGLVRVVIPDLGVLARRVVDAGQYT